ncbi:class I SAM-dependent methyltransferase [Stenotrophomonas aracearum]|jgi:SAM-dependent methyltransferase|uniref:Class I SAM-dependent methyltransferase n=1 Tax=Stenotrophomonas aracearum TaxID=3003272 RepID=A0ABY9Y9T5_9GAMM|nr:class I SAM-dependent methyltransferase [Stenotrophomonas sp. A5588]WNH47168.1 class I SAM-dependent methyltransferase [Stenotrophomonas sp. A5588]
MPSTPPTQHDLWNGPAGDAWVQAQSLLDGMFAGFVSVLADPVDPAAHVLDVGCGTGALCLAIASRLGPDGRCGGVDISAPMIDVARERARSAGQSIDFTVADAEQHAFAPASLDRIVSRFGVMFFNDPVQAFANLRRALRSGGSLHAIAWRGPADNPFMTTAERVAAPLLTLPARAEGGPGQFAFADADKVRGILKDAGWKDIQITQLDVECSIPADQLPTYVSLLGPVGQALRAADLAPADRTRILQTVVDAFAPFVQGDNVVFNAACWSIRAV